MAYWSTGTMVEAASSYLLMIIEAEQGVPFVKREGDRQVFQMESGRYTFKSEY
jgi:hypothetical protein